MTTQGHIILGTAGHIDHGKTSLVKVLTGVNTDRLKEEQERGITIELGFAPLTLPSGVRFGLVDVPGHERFVKNMVAGATGIDVVLMVIAADEGVMPQTREHLEICQLLGVKRGLVALTKVDMVDEEWLELVTEEVREYLAGTFLEDAPIIPFSAVDQTGREDLLVALDGLATEVPGRSGRGIFRLPVDRVFSMKGFGTVVTGTLISGSIAGGEEVVFVPGDRKARIRGLQVHGESVDRSAAGTRTALNLQGIDKEEIHRGQTAARPGTLVASLMIDARLSLLPSASRPLKNRNRVRLHLFTAEVMARVILLEGEVLEPGAESWVQLRLESPAIALPGDRFVLRSYSPMTTIGGGVVLDPLPAKHRRNRPSVLRHLDRLDTDDPAQRITAFLDAAGDFGISAGSLSVRIGTELERTLEILSSLAAEGRVVMAGEGATALAYGSDSFDKLKERTLRALARFHEANPTRAGIGREELRMRVARDLPDRPYRNLLSALADQREIVLSGDLVRLGGHEATLTPQQETLAKKAIQALSDGLSVPLLPELAEALQADTKALKDVLGLLVDRGDLVRIKDDYFITPAAHTDLLEKVDAYFEENAEMAMPDFRDLVEATRKWMIPLLEYLDRVQVTMRKGDVRIRRGRMARE